MKFLFALMTTVLMMSDAVVAAEYDTTKWQGDAKRFAADDESQPTEPGGVVFVGSSSIRMWDLEKSFPDKDYLNRGFGGSEIADTTHYLNKFVAKHKPSIVVFYAGDNDVAHGKSPERVFSDFQEFAKKFNAELPEAKLVYIAIKPSIARWKLADRMREANKMIEAECEKHDNFAFLDVWPVMLDDDGEPRDDIFLGDGLHMNETGYQAWVDLLEPHLE